MPPSPLNAQSLRLSNMKIISSINPIIMLGILAAQICSTSAWSGNISTGTMVERNNSYRTKRMLQYKFQQCRQFHHHQPIRASLNSLERDHDNDDNAEDASVGVGDSVGVGTSVPPSLIELLMPNSKCNPTQMSPTSLAYIGDSVFELFVRSRYVWPSRRTTDLQKIVVGRVRGRRYNFMMIMFCALYLLHSSFNN